MTSTLVEVLRWCLDPEQDCPYGCAMAFPDDNSFSLLTFGVLFLEWQTFLE